MKFILEFTCGLKCPPASPDWFEKRGIKTKYEQEYGGYRFIDEKGETSDSVEIEITTLEEFLDIVEQSGEDSVVVYKITEEGNDGIQYTIVMQAIAYY